MTAIGVATNAGLFHKTKNPFYLYSAVALALTFPVSVFALKPVNKNLIAIREVNTVQGKANSLKDSASDDSVVDRLLNRWNLVHASRTVLGFGALLSALYAIIADDSVHFILFK